MEIVVMPEALADLRFWHKSGTNASRKKIERIFVELSQTPFEGVGQPEPLRYEFSGYWSRRIDKANRIIYKVDETISKVFVISARGHYGDR